MTPVKHRVSRCGYASNWEEFCAPMRITFKVEKNCPLAVYLSNLDGAEFWLRREIGSSCSRVLSAMRDSEGNDIKISEDSAQFVLVPTGSYELVPLDTGASVDKIGIRVEEMTPGQVMLAKSVGEVVYA